MAVFVGKYLLPFCSLHYAALPLPSRRRAGLCNPVPSAAPGEQWPLLRVPAAAAQGAAQPAWHSGASIPTDATGLERRNGTLLYAGLVYLQLNDSIRTGVQDRAASVFFSMAILS